MAFPGVRIRGRDAAHDHRCGDPGDPKAMQPPLRQFPDRAGARLTRRPGPPSAVRRLRRTAAMATKPAPTATAVSAGSGTAGPGAAASVKEKRPSIRSLLLGL